MQSSKAQPENISPRVKGLSQTLPKEVTPCVVQAPVSLLRACPLRSMWGGMVSLWLNSSKATKGCGLNRGWSGAAMGKGTEGTRLILWAAKHSKDPLQLTLIFILPLILVTKNGSDFKK